MRSLEDHLSPRELASLPESTEILAADEPAQQELSQHLQHCEQCSKLAQVHRSLRSLGKTSGPPFDIASCPPQTLWLEVATGILTTEKSSALLAHAAGCDSCAGLMQEAMELMQADQIDRGSEHIEGLASATPEWQRDVAARMRATYTRPPQPLPPNKAAITNPWRWRDYFTLSAMWSIAGAAAVLLVIAGSLLLRSDSGSLERTNQLLAKAYTQHRTLDLRIPGAAYGPLRVTRGENGSHSDRSLSLLQAETQIAAEKARGNKDARWLVAAARADLIEGDYGDAIRSLQQAATVKPDLLETKLELATAYFERAKKSGSGTDFGLAAETIGEVLEKDPDNVVAIFNRALIYQRMYLYSQAVKDWQHYLKLDASGEWAQEAREHLADVESKIEEKQKAANDQTLFTPDAIAGMSGISVSDTAIDLRIEDYQRRVVTQWYPDLLRQRTILKTENQLSLQLAIQRVAEVSTVQHHDLLLRDLIASKNLDDGRSLPPAKDLSAAISANQSGDEQHAFERARRAYREFQRTGNVAGALRSRFEMIYAMQFSSQILPCVHLANELAIAASQRRYSWLAAQAQIEAGFCGNMTGNLAFAKERLQRAALVARIAHYEGAADRALVGNAAMQLQAGSVLATWGLALEGLRDFWASSVPNVRGESLYDLLDLMAEEKQQWRLQHALLMESLSLLERGDDQLSTAQALVRLAGCELMLHQAAAAKVSLSKALEFFRSAPHTSSTLNQELIVSINLAKAEALSDDYLASAAQLERLRPQVRRLHENLSALDFYSTLGEAYRRLGKRREAEDADRAAIDLFRASLSTLVQPRDRLTWYQQVSPAYRSLVQLRFDENNISEALQLWQDYRKAMVPAERGLAGSSGNMLIGGSASGRTILVFADLPEGPFAWAISGAQIKAIHLPEPYETITNVGHVFADECSVPSSDIADLTTTGKYLYRILIEPFAAFMPNGRTIVIEPDEGLAQIPFSALIDRNGSYLNATHDIVMSPFAAPLIRSQSKIKPITVQDNAFLVESRSAAGNDHAEDSLSEREITTVASLFPNSTVLGPQSAAKVRFGKLLSRAALFHYAGHSGTTGRGGALMLAERDSDGHEHLVSLRSDDIKAAWLGRCKLAVLSACQTDRGQGGHWLDRDNMAVTLLNAGVPQVVASRWDVDSGATTAFMKVFYANLVRGSSISESLRDAAENIRHRTGYKHPYYWAAFSALECTT